MNSRSKRKPFCKKTERHKNNHIRIVVVLGRIYGKPNLLSSERSDNIADFTGFVKLFFEMQNAIFFEMQNAALLGNKTLIQQEIFNPDILNAIVVPPRFHIIFHNDDFLEGIRNSDQGSNLLFLLIRIIDG